MLLYLHAALKRLRSTDAEPRKCYLIGRDRVWSVARRALTKPCAVHELELPSGGDAELGEHLAQMPSTVRVLRNSLGRDFGVGPSVARDE